MSGVPIDLNQTGRCLDVGSGPESIAKSHFPNMEVTRLDADPALNPDVVHDITQPLPEALRGQFDLVYLSHVLEHIEWRSVVAVLANLHAALVPGGRLLVLVPSLEWVAEQVLSERPSPLINPYLFGRQINPWQYHKSGFSLMLLRQVFRLSGYVEEYVGRSPLEMSVGDKVYHVLQNVGLARASELTAADAIG